MLSKTRYTYILISILPCFDTNKTKWTRPNRFGSLSLQLEIQYQPVWCLKDQDLCCHQKYLKDWGSEKKKRFNHKFSWHFKTPLSKFLYIVEYIWFGTYKPRDLVATRKQASIPEIFPRRLQPYHLTSHVLRNQRQAAATFFPTDGRTDEL